jgi:hypothetical protein
VVLTQSIGGFKGTNLHVRMLMGDFHDKSVKTDKKELGTEEISIVGKKT